MNFVTRFGLLVVIGGLTSPGHGFKQQLGILLEDGRTLYFDKAVPDLAPHRQLLQTNNGVHEYCVRGLWFGFLGVNFGSYDRVLPDYVGTGSELKCGSDFFGTIESLRHVAANDTSVHSLSLYSGHVYSQEEILVTGKAVTGMKSEIRSLVSTGTSAWTLFQGLDLDGHSICFSAPAHGESFHSAGGYGPITSIGSVFKGCDPHALHLYKEQNNIP